ALRSPAGTPWARECREDRPERLCTPWGTWLGVYAFMCLCVYVGDWLLATEDWRVIPHIHHPLPYRRILLRVLRCQGCQAVDIAVEHGKRGGDQHGIMDGAIVGAVVTCPLDVFRRYLLATLLNLARNDQQRFHLFTQH